MVSDHVTFSSRSFPIEPGEDQETNPGIYGKALAVWVAERLKSRGVAVEGFAAEDFGRCVIVTRKPVLLFIAIASDDNQATKWQMYVAVEQRPLRKLFWPANPEPAFGAFTRALSRAGCRHPRRPRCRVAIARAQGVASVRSR